MKSSPFFGIETAALIEELQRRESTERSLNRAIKVAGEERVTAELHRVRVIISTTCEFFGTDPEIILGRRRTDATVAARHVAMALCRSLLKLTLMRIGMHFNRHHSDIIHAVQRTNALAPLDAIQLAELTDHCIARLSGDDLFSWNPVPVCMATQGRAIYLFKPQFRDLIISRIKTSTIRPPRKRKTLPGMMLNLRVWTAKAYRSPQETILDAIAVSCENISIGQDGWADHLGGWFTADSAEAAELARTEGFADYAELSRWFAAEHGPEIFHGERLQWE